MREFNVTGPCDPERHFTVRRQELIRLGMAKVEAGRYFTIFAPRQAGKTTYFLELLREIARVKTAFCRYGLRWKNCAIPARAFLNFSRLS